MPSSSCENRAEAAGSYPVPDAGLIPAGSLHQRSQGTRLLAALGFRQQRSIALDQIQGVAGRHAHGVADMHILLCWLSLCLRLVTILLVWLMPILLVGLLTILL